jgi:TonB family protein
MLPAVAFSQDATLKIAEAEARRIAIDKPSPAYPATARQLKITGKVQVEAVIDEQGGVEEVRIISGNPVLTKPAAEAVKKWRFKSFEAGGRKTKAVASLSFEFDAR